MKAKAILSILILMLSINVFSQSTGTLKIFSEESVIVYVDQVQHPKYDAIVLAVGTHYVKITNAAGFKLYSQIVTITQNQVTSVLVEGNTATSPAATATSPVQKIGNESLNTVKGMQKTGTLNIFCELTECSVYLNETKLGVDIKTVPNVPIGDHYLKVMKDGIGIFGELISIKEGQVTTVLVKNDGQVAEKIMEGKTQERQEYQAKKIDVLFTTNSVSTTQGASTLFPGYYGYWGYSSSTTNTQQIADFKIVQGGVKEIGDISLATAVNNQAILNQYAAVNTAVAKQTTVGAVGFLASLLIGVPILVDQLSENHFLHEGTVCPDWQTYTLAATVITGTISYFLVMNADKQIPKHYYRVDDAAKDAKKHNDKLKKDLGLPESYDVK